MVIRSHGVSEKVIRQLEKYDIKIVDATCPFVSKIHRIVQQKYREGYRIVIIGSRTHPEVEGINGWCEDSAAVLETVDEAENFHPDPQKKLCIVSQTTFNYKKFKDMVAIFEKKSYDILVMNTICNATEERQTGSERYYYCKAIRRDVDDGWKTQARDPETVYKKSLRQRVSNTCLHTDT